jgi:molybdate transport system substrate-binding protein
MSERSRAEARALPALAAALVLAGCGRSGDGGRRGEPLRVAAAADLALAFEEIGAGFQKSTGRRVEVTLGSTGLLARQIAEGAPFDVFAAANVSFVDDVVRAGACDGATKQLYAQGRLVVWSRDATMLPRSVAELADPRFKKIALAQPEHAPYGRAAREALVASGVWAGLEPRVVYGENVQQTLMFAQTGNAEVAVVALSLAIVSEGHYLPLDPATHAPLDQALVVCNGGRREKETHEARAFVEYVNGSAGRAIMQRYGFLLPGEALSTR